ncbi:MAG: hypothetical protein ACN4GG_04390 [Akkermansiaceae bacterium]
MSSSHPSRLLCIIPLLLGITLSLTIQHVPPLVKLEHRLFWFPKPQESFVKRKPLTDFQLQVSDISPLDQPLVETRILETEKPLAVTDWLFALNAVRTNGATHVTISPLLSWPDPVELELRALEHEITNFDSAALGYDLRRASAPTPFPNYLTPSILTKVEGDLSTIPKVNTITIPPSITTGTQGFRILENAQPKIESNSMTIPLLAQWDENILPSFELASLIARTDTKPDEVKVTLGKHIQIGDSGIILPIDSSGHIIVPSDSERPGAAENLTVLTDPEKQESPPHLLILSKASPPHLRKFSQTISHLSSRISRDHQSYRRLPFWAEIPFLIFFTLVLQARKPLALLLIPAPFLFTLFTQQWFLLLPPLLIFTSFMGIKKALKKKSPKERPRKTHKKR